jgi:dolichyl-phosphate mannosyltransferase polypeptide 3
LILAILFGVVAVANITYHMIMFKECPKAYEELMKDIKEAKTELTKKGIKFN